MGHYSKNMSSQHQKIVDEITAWAESEIGRPPLPVTGASNLAHVDMVKQLGENSNFPSEATKFKRAQYMLHTKRIDFVEICHENRPKQCGKKLTDGFGWGKHATETDWAVYENVNEI